MIIKFKIFESMSGLTFGDEITHEDDKKIDWIVDETGREREECIKRYLEFNKDAIRAIETMLNEVQDDEDIADLMSDTNLDEETCRQAYYDNNKNYDAAYDYLTNDGPEDDGGYDDGGDGYDEEEDYINREDTFVRRNTIYNDPTINVIKSFILKDIFDEFGGSRKKTVDKLKELVMGKTVRVEDKDGHGGYVSVNEGDDEEVWDETSPVTNVMSYGDDPSRYFRFDNGNGDNLELLIDDRITIIEHKKVEPKKQITTISKSDSKDSARWWEHGKVDI
jgi:hypothetical protein